MQLKNQYILVWLIKREYPLKYNYNIKNRMANFNDKKIKDPWNKAKNKKDIYKSEEVLICFNINCQTKELLSYVVML